MAATELSNTSTFTSSSLSTSQLSSTNVSGISQINTGGKYRKSNSQLSRSLNQIVITQQATIQNPAVMFQRRMVFLMAFCVGLFCTIAIMSYIVYNFFLAVEEATTLPICNDELRRKKLRCRTVEPLLTTSAVALPRVSKVEQICYIDQKELRTIFLDVTYTEQEFAKQVVERYLPLSCTSVAFCCTSTIGVIRRSFDRELERRNLTRNYIFAVPLNNINSSQMFLFNVVVDERAKDVQRLLEDHKTFQYFVLNIVPTSKNAVHLILKLLKQMRLLQRALRFRTILSIPVLQENALYVDFIKEFYNRITKTPDSKVVFGPDFKTFRVMISSFDMENQQKLVNGSLHCPTEFTVVANSMKAIYDGVASDRDNGNPETWFRDMMKHAIVTISLRVFRYIIAHNKLEAVLQAQPNGYLDTMCYLVNNQSHRFKRFDPLEFPHIKHAPLVDCDFYTNVANTRNQEIYWAMTSFEESSLKAHFEANDVIYGVGNFGSVLYADLAFDSPPNGTTACSIQFTRSTKFNVYLSRKQ